VQIRAQPRPSQCHTPTVGADRSGNSAGLQLSKQPWGCCYRNSRQPLPQKWASLLSPLSLFSWVTEAQEWDVVTRTKKQSLCTSFFLFLCFVFEIESPLCKPRLASNLQSSCFSLLSAGIADVYHHNGPGRSIGGWYWV
jgi:hypothetical protein